MLFTVDFRTRCGEGTQREIGGFVVMDPQKLDILPDMVCWNIEVRFFVLGSRLQERDDSSRRC